MLASVEFFGGHPDDWWGGHDWDFWWSLLPVGDRARLLELGWGDEPAPLLGIILTSLRGATDEVVEEVLESLPLYAYVRRRVVHRATDEFLIWLEEKRGEPDHR